MRPPKLNALRAFDAAARHLNFRLAAGELNVTQGAIAQNVRGLEADLGVRLFRRLARGLALTESGAAYHGDIARGLALIDEATRKLYPKTDSVTVSVPPSFASKWLVPRLPYFFEAHPGTEVKTIASEAVTEFRAQDVDVAVRQGARPVDRDLSVAKLAPMDLCAVCGASDGMGGAETGDIFDFAKLTLIQDSHRHWERLLDEYGIERPRHILQFNQTALAMDAAVNGQGYAIAPRLLCADDLAAGHLVEVWADIRRTENGFWLVHPDNDPPNRKARAYFVDWLMAEFR